VCRRPKRPAAMGYDSALRPVASPQQRREQKPARADLVGLGSGRPVLSDPSISSPTISTRAVTRISAPRKMFSVPPRVGPGHGRDHDHVGLLLVEGDGDQRLDGAAQREPLSGVAMPKG
jgi:hypothetical protein